MIMIADYTEPMYHSRYLGVAEVEYAIDVIQTTEDPNLRNGLLLELYQHLADYECAHLRKALAALSARFGHKRYEKPPTMSYISQPGVELLNIIFKTKIHDVMHRDDVDIDLRLLHLWIKQNFIPLCQHRYSWFALWRFFSDKRVLKNDKISDFCEQMEIWFYSPAEDSSLKPDKDSVWRYNGYLSVTPYLEWNEQEYTKKKRKDQSAEGFNHLKKICYALAGKWNVAMLKNRST